MIAPRRAGWSLLADGLRRARRPMIRLAGWSGVQALPAFVSGTCTAAAVDQGFLAGRPWTGLAWLGGYGVALLLRAAAARRVFAPLADVVEPIRDDLVRHVVTGTVLRATRGSGRPEATGAAQLTEQVQPVRGVVAALLVNARQVTVALVAALLGLATLALPAALLVIPTVLVSLLLFVLLLPRLSRRARAVLLTGEAVSRDTTQVVSQARDVVACGAHPVASREVLASIDADAAARRAQASSEAARLAIGLIGGQLPMIVLLLGAGWLRDGMGLTPGQLVGAVTYVSLSVDPALNACVSMIGAWGVQLDSALARLAEAGPPGDGPAGTVAPASVRRTAPTGTPRGYELRTRGLTFRYGPTADPVIDGLSLEIPPGDHLAIVGASGIGKSTLANLMAGLTGGATGQVLLGGRPLDTLDPREVRRLVTLVPQEAYVFAGTLRENLTYLNPAADDTALDRVTSQIGLSPLLHRFDGYDTPVGSDGVTLSAGERQLVTLARVHLSPAPVIILDEGTCHLDPAAEAVAEAALAARPGTLVVIAHRLASALRARRILVLDGRRPVVGTHAELLASSRMYRDLLGHWACRD